MGKTRLRFIISLRYVLFQFRRFNNFLRAKFSTLAANDSSSLFVVSCHFFFTKHINSQPNLFPSLTSTLFNLLLFGPPQNHWAVVKPMLSLMLASENSFTSYKEHLISTQTRENQHLLSEAFNKLLHDVQRSLDSANRDRFTQRLTAFRVAARSFLTL